MYNYCTLFDSRYLTRGLAMYESLKHHSQQPFHLYILACDTPCFYYLKKINLPYVTVISLNDFEDQKLLRIKRDRTDAEYYWTCTPSIILYSIKQFGLDHCTYVDADIYFFSNPGILIEEMGHYSISLTAHRYTPKYDQSNTSGIYCVQFMTFKNNDTGNKALQWWRDACIDWCYARCENGKFGDQKYLDDWLQRFEGVYVLQHQGAGMAPWNIQQYDVVNNKFQKIFYHFHQCKFVAKNKTDLGRYTLNREVIEYIYKPYLRHLQAIYQKIKNVDSSLKIRDNYALGFHWKQLLRCIKRYLMGNYNVYKLSKLLK